MKALSTGMVPADKSIVYNNKNKRLFWPAAQEELVYYFLAYWIKMDGLQRGVFPTDINAIVLWLGSGLEGKADLLQYV